jgi:hypothetical protein
MAISNSSQIDLERSVYWALRAKLIEKGYLPNSESFTGNPNGYTAAVNAIIALKGFSIELFGVGANLERGIKESPRITIDSRAFSKGEIGFTQAPYFEATGNTTNKKKAPATTMNLVIEVTLTSRNSTQDRVLNEVFAEVFESYGYLNHHEISGINFFYERDIARDYRGVNAGLLDRTYPLVFKDLLEKSPKILNTTANISEIKIDLIPEPNKGTIDTITIVP